MNSPGPRAIRSGRDGAGSGTTRGRCSCYRRGNGGLPARSCRRDCRSRDVGAIVFAVRRVPRLDLLQIRSTASRVANSSRGRLETAQVTRLAEAGFVRRLISHGRGRRYAGGLGLLENSAGLGAGREGIVAVGKNGLCACDGSGEDKRDGSNDESHIGWSRSSRAAVTGIMARNCRPPSRMWGNECFCPCC